MKPIDRRQFLLTSGYLSIGFSLWGCKPGGAASPSTGGTSDFILDDITPPLPDASQIDAWLQVLGDGTIQVITGRMELGQGLRVVMQQVAGEELNTPPHKIDVVLADTGLTQNEGTTAGSRSVERSAMIVRRAAAAAREYLIQLAAEHWQIRADKLSMKEGEVVDRESDRRLSLKELLTGKQLNATIPNNVSLKPKDQYQWVGRPIPHPDMDKIVRGEALYVQDMRLPKMVHARVVRPPVYGARLESTPSVADLPGVLKVVENGSFLAVIAEEEFHAVRAAEALRKGSQWSGGQSLQEVESWSEFMTEGGGRSSEPSAESASHHAVYSKPYIMHGSIGPSCAIAAYQDGRLHIWSHTQGVYPLKATLSHMTGLPEDSIRVTGVRGSGCYGHNGADDVGADAALIAMAFPDRPVRLQWERADEHQWEPYGSAMRMEISARLDTQGKITDWNYHLWSDGHSSRPRGGASHLLPARYLETPFPFRASNRVGGGTRNAEPYYRIPQAEVTDHHVPGPLRVSALRGLGAFANIFAIESFMEELAEKAGRDPLAFRIDHSDDERSIAVLRALQDMVKEAAVDSDEGLGFGFSRYKNTASYCAIAAKVKVDRVAQTVRPIKMWAVLDAGEAINTDGLKNQTEGGMIQAASWTLKEEVRFDHTGVTSRDWASYPILRSDVTPETEVVILNRPELPPLGAGEAAQGPAGAAVTNAVYAATGKRIRHLPIEKYLFG